jgi:hypothetical protein
MGIVKFFDELVGMDVGQGFPTIMCLGEPFSSDQVLKLIAVFSGA